MICSQCKKKFTPTHSRQKYCSQECAKIKKIERQKKYSRSDKAREAQKKYRATQDAKIVQATELTRVSEKRYYEKLKYGEKKIEKKIQTSKLKSEKKIMHKKERDIEMTKFSENIKEKLPENIMLKIQR